MISEAKLKKRHRRRLLLEQLEDRSLLTAIGINLSTGTELRNYRLAVAATAEYTAFHGGQEQALAAIQTTVDGLNAIFEPEAAIHFDLVSGTNTIYTDPVTDPYTNGSVESMSSENQANLDAVIGDDGYDLGHVFGLSSGGGNGEGLAGLGIVGVQGEKALAASISDWPQGDTWLAIVAHEIAHQFNASHTFNSTRTADCASARRAEYAYEPASGSTLMSYAGSCGADDLQQDEDLYLHAASFDQIESFIRSQASAAPHSTTPLVNHMPTVDGGPDFTIPADTPFVLTASGSDLDGDRLTYAWEQLDLGSPQGLPLSDLGSGPLFRSFPATENPSRTFPALPDLLSNLSTAERGETLPQTDRELNFRVTVRDGRGGVSSDDVLLDVYPTGSAFRVTSPDTAVTWLGGSQQTVTWSVAGTASGPIQAGTVDIQLSVDGGLTYPVTLATTANDGSHQVIVPNINTSEARIRVQPVGNVFFDVSNANFIIQANPVLPRVEVIESEGSTWAVEGGEPDSYQIALATAPAGPVTIVAASESQTLLSADGNNFASAISLVLDSTTPRTVYVAAINDAAEEGPHTSRITHSITASSSAVYPVGMLIEMLTVNVYDDDLPPVVGLDFGINGTPSPENWTSQEFLNDPPPTEMIRDDGLQTAYDLAFEFVGHGELTVVGSTIPSEDGVPRHLPMLTELGGHATFTGPMRAIWSDLTPGAEYEIYVFGLKQDTAAYSQRIAISGASPLPEFVQVLSDRVLYVNEQTGSSSRTLDSYGKTVTADSSGKITIAVSPEAGSAGISLAGLAIRRVPSGGTASRSPAILVEPPACGVAVAETGTTAVFQVSLSTRPDIDVTLNATLAPSDQAELDQTSLVFTPSNWNVPQPLTLTGRDDSQADGDQVIQITLAVDTGISDAAYAAAVDRVIEGWVVDSDRWQSYTHPVDVNVDGQIGALDVLTLINDINRRGARPLPLPYLVGDKPAPYLDVTGDGEIGPLDVLTAINFLNTYGAGAVPAISIQPNDDEIRVSESGEADEFYLALTRRPRSDVVVDIQPSDPGQVNPGRTQIVFTPNDWNVPRKVTLQAVADGIADGDQRISLRLSIDAGASDNAWDEMLDNQLNVLVLDA